MAIRAVLLILLGLRSVFAEEQIWQEWAKDYQFSQSSSQDHLNLLRPVQDGYLLIGSTVDGWLKPWIVRVQDDGSVVWNKTVDSVDSAFFVTALDAVANADGTFVIVSEVNGTTSRAALGLNFFNAQGEVKSQFQLPGGEQVPDASIIPAPGGGYTVAASASTFTNGQATAEIRLYKLDAAGRTNAEQVLLTGENTAQAPSLWQTPEGYLLMWDNVIVTPDRVIGVWEVARLEPGLQVLSRTRYPFVGTSGVLREDQSIAVVTLTPSFFSFVQFIAPDGSLGGPSDAYGMFSSRLAVGQENDLWASARDVQPTYWPELFHLSAAGKILSKASWHYSSEFDSLATEVRAEPGNRVKALGGRHKLPALFQFSADQVPDGTPQVFINGGRQHSYNLVGLSYEMTVGESNPNVQLFYTLDGSTNLTGAQSLSGYSTVELNSPAVIRALALDRNGVLLPSRPVTVDFLPSYTVHLLTAGGGSLSPGTYGGSVPYYPSNTTVRVLAEPNSGWKFLRWEGGLAGTNATQDLTLRSNVEANAVFGTDLTLVSSAGGTVLADHAGGTYAYGERAVLAALPEPGYYFAGWSNVLSDGTASLRLSVTNANPSVSALFLPLASNQVALTIVENGNGQVIASSQTGAVPRGTQVTLNAAPEPGSHFLGWTGDVASREPDIFVTVTNSMRLVAGFSDGIRALYPPVIELRASAAARGNPQLQIFTAPGATVVVEQSPDLNAWTTVGTFTPTDGSLNIPVTSTNRLFFRARFAD